MSYKTTLVSVGGSVSGTDRPGTGEKPGTGEDKPSTGETAASAVHNFTTDYTTADSFFTISGNLADKKGTNKYNGLNLTSALKLKVQHQSHLRQHQKESLCL